MHVPVLSVHGPSLVQPLGVALTSLVGGGLPGLLLSDLHPVAMVSVFPGVHAAGHVNQAVVEAKVQIKFATVRGLMLLLVMNTFHLLIDIYYLLIILSMFTDAKYTLCTNFSIVAQSFPCCCNAHRG